MRNIAITIAVLLWLTILGFLVKHYIDLPLPVESEPCPQAVEPVGKSQYR